MQEFAVILMYTTSHAIRGERVLLKVGIQAKLVPTPRHLSSDCGSAIRISAADQSRSVARLEGEGVPFDRIEIIEE
jgi:hypothetical protein